MTSDEKLVQQLRETLKPGGTLPIVRLHFSPDTNKYFNLDFVTKCIDEIERMPTRAVLGEPMTNLERLAIILLCDSAYIDVDNQRKEMK